MRKRGRSSAAPLHALPAIEYRPDPPASLTDEAKAIWRDAVTTQRAGYFHGCEPLLEVYARAVAMERDLARQLAEVTPGSRLAFELHRAYRGQAALVGNVATKLRLTVRSKVDRYISPGPPPGPRPWHIPA